MNKNFAEKVAKENRTEQRRAELRNHRIEIKFVGEPIYQFRVVNVTSKGAGILIKDDSVFLNMIKKDQIIEVNLLSPQGANPSGVYSAKIRHITSPNKQEFKGHRLVGISTSTLHKF